MAHIAPDDLRDPEYIYLARSFGEARDVEALLSARGVDYAVQVETLGRTTLFGSLRHGAAFYVTSAQASYCRSLLLEEGMARGIVDGHPDADGDRPS